MRLTQQLPSIGWSRSRARLAGLVLLSCSLLATAAQAATPTVPAVDDRAGLFSDSAVKNANQIIKRIYENTTPHKQVFVETLPALPAGKEADALSAERFRQHNADGLLILMVKAPHKLAVTVGRATEERFHDAGAARKTMLERFRQDDYDGGLLAGLHVVESGFRREFTAGAPVSARVKNSESQPEQAGSSPWLWLLLLGGGGLLAVGVWRFLGRRASASSSYQPQFGERGLGHGLGSAGPSNIGYGAGGVGGGGGGWARPVLGGVAGALAGNWLYDRLFHGDREGLAHAATGAAPEDHSAAEADHGEVGSTLGGYGAGDDWGDSDGAADVGGDSADW